MRSPVRARAAKGVGGGARECGERDRKKIKKKKEITRKTEAMSEREKERDEERERKKGI